MGAGLGGLAGAIANRSRVGALAGALTGGALGLLGGGLYGVHDRAEIEEFQYIMGLNPRERKEYLAAKARDSEIEAQMAHQESLHARDRRAMMRGNDYYRGYYR